MTHEHVQQLADAALGRLFGQWFEAVEVVDGQVLGLVTSRGWIVRGQMHVNGVSVPRSDDSHIVGHVIVNSTIDPDGTLTIHTSKLDATASLEIRINSPWLAVGPRSCAVQARHDGVIGVHPEGPNRIATSEAVAAWRSAGPNQEEFEVLRRATDDWMSPADIAGILAEGGVEDTQEVTKLGIDILAGLLVRGDLEAGAVTDNGFEASAEPIEDLIETVATTWMALSNRRLSPGQIVWLNLTESGSARLTAYEGSLFSERGLVPAVQPPRS